MARSAESITETASSAVGKYGLAGLIKRYGFGGVFLALAYALIDGIQSFGNTVTAPFTAFGNGLAELVEAIVGAPVSIVEQSARYTGFSITYGEWGFFGPLTFAVGVGATMLGLYVFTITIRRLELRPWRLLRGLR